MPTQEMGGALLPLHLGMNGCGTLRDWVERRPLSGRGLDFGAPVMISSKDRMRRARVMECGFGAVCIRLHFEEGQVMRVWRDGRA